MNIEEKLLDSEVAPMKRIQLSEKEKQELRRMQQEKALGHQIKIDEYIRESVKSLLENVKDEGDDQTGKEDEVGKNELIIESAPPLRQGQDENKTEISHDDAEQMDQEEFDRLVQDYNKTIDRKNNEEIGKKLKSVVDANKRRVKWSDKSENPRIVDDDEDEDEVDYEPSESEVDSDDYVNETVRTPKPSRILIKHTRNEKLAEIERNLAVSRDRPEINSPGDIYRYFLKPKSILKNSEVNIASSSDVNKIQAHVEVKPETKFEPHKVNLHMKKIILSRFL